MTDRRSTDLDIVGPSGVHDVLDKSAIEARDRAFVAHVQNKPGFAQAMKERNAAAEPAEASPAAQPQRPNDTLPASKSHRLPTAPRIRETADSEKDTKPGLGPGAPDGGPFGSLDSTEHAGGNDANNENPAADPPMGGAPFAGNWQPQNKKHSGPINVGGQTGKLGVVAPVGAVVLPAASPLDATQLTPRKQFERRRRAMWMGIAVFGIVLVIAGVTFVRRDDSDKNVSVSNDPTLTAPPSEPTGAPTHPPPLTATPQPSPPSVPTTAHPAPSSTDAPPATATTRPKEHPVQTARPTATAQPNEFRDEGWGKPR